MTTRRYSLDPDDPASTDALETRLGEALAPVSLESAVASALRQRLLERARASRAAAGRFINVRRDEGQWRPLGSNARFKLLHESTVGRSVIVDLLPGGSLPTHRHHEHEECVVLRGSAELGPLTVHEGDYHVAPAGSRHGHVSSRDGALLYLRGVPIGDTAEVVRDLVTAWLPGKGPAPITVRADEGAWEDVLPGIAAKSLWRHGVSHSLLLRMAPGARVQLGLARMDEERLLLQGEIFVGDMLLRTGDYQFAPDPAAEAELATDVGALMFVRGPSTGSTFASRV